MVLIRFLFLVLVLLLSLALPASAGSVLNLEALLRLGLAGNPALLAQRSRVEAAQGMAQAARAYPNPEISGQTGSATERNVLNPISGSVYSYGISQPIENPFTRSARIDAADSSLQATDALRRAFEDETLAQIKLAYYALLRSQAEEQAARDDVDLTQAIRDRIALKLNVGESAKFDLIKAETELLNARKTLDAASYRTLQARSSLRLAVGPSLPPEATIAGELPTSIPLPPITTLEEELRSRNPDLQRLEAERSAAEYRVDLEKSQRLPKITVSAQHDVDPTLSSSRAGIQFTIPLWDFRSGPVAQAQAEVAQSRHQSAAQHQALEQSLVLAYDRYQLASRQVAMLENQLLVQASEARRIAEAAYRYGERGILDWLDAQRTYRAARNELIGARFDLAASVVDIDRLRSEPPLTP